MTQAERQAISRLWAVKAEHDRSAVTLQQRHRNLEPDSAAFIHALALAIRARQLLEVGGSSGVSTIALASAARRNGGRLTSIEVEPLRQREAQKTIADLGLSDHVEFICGDATALLPGLGTMDLVLLDCEKEDYIRFFHMLSVGARGVVVADNILSHHLSEYVDHVRLLAPSVTLAIGKGLELSSGPISPRSL